MPDVSVVLCTYNRARELRDALAGLRDLRTDGTFEYEVLIVDNNSTDETKAVVEEERRAFAGRLRYVFEPRQGLSYARNTGAREARGTILAFTDDDVRVHAGWLAGLRAGFQRFGADCVYGKILPIWMDRRPEWLTEFFFGKLAILDYGEAPFIVTSDTHQLIGANFAVTKDVLTTLGGFDVQLGRTGTTLRMGEDTELFLKLLTGGRKIVYQPEAVVLHKVPKERMTMRYFRQWHIDQGRSAAHLNIYDQGALWLGIPRWTMRKFLSAVCRYVTSLTPMGKPHRISSGMKLLYYFGLFSERQRMFWRGRRTCRTSA